ncbi:MAG TPA: metallophosphoesterase, partial [Gaiellales bacterium]|nr:metallophosphoesterase [Gaiellales bacterium]
ALAAFGDAGAAAVLVLGDLTDRGRPEQFEAALKVLAGSGLPAAIVPGNHDLEGPGPAEPAAASAAGRPRSVPAGAAALAPVALTGTWPTDDGLEYRLGSPAGDPGALPVVLSHYPVLSRKQALATAGLKYAGDLGPRAGLEREVRALGRHVVALCGHLHVRDAVADGGLLQLSFGAMIEYPHEAALLEVDPAGRVSRRCFPVEPHPPGNGADPVLAPAEDRWIAAEDGWRRA